MIYWDRVKGWKSSLAVVVGTALGAGLFPKAPGTMGTAFGVPLAILTRNAPVQLRFLLWVTLTVIGTWSAKVLDELMDTGDNQCIVIDEVVGLGITAWTVTSLNPWEWFAAFALFRFFDIIKIFPVRGADRWSKKKAKENAPLSKWWGGFGVMLDDVLAGFQGLAVMILLQRAHLF